MRYVKLMGFFAVSSAIALCSVPAAAADENIDQLIDMPIKDLVNVEVTSVSKKSEKASEAAAAIYVITQEDIKRSGVTTIPEALRMAPGIQVARIDAGTWEITARGFANSSEFDNKLLVLIDGRSVYNPLFSGVLWEEQGVPIEDIERIEVIRGPGSTLWGANAVNGVINIITKNSKDTQGNLASAGAGTFDKFSGLVQHGGKINDSTTYRAYAQDYEQGNTYHLNGESKEDSYHISRTGFRSDGNPDPTSNFTLQGDAYKGDRNEPFDRLPSLTGTLTSSGLTVDAPDTHDMLGGNILGKYDKRLSNGSDLAVQMYYDYTQRELDIFSQKINTFDIDVQHSFNLSENHSFMWGAGYRLVNAQLANTELLRYSEDDLNQTTNLFSTFVQDKIQLMPDELFLTLGSKLEHNDYTGFEVEPNIRLTWLPTNNQTVWAAVTRAVRTPSMNEMSLTQVIAATPIPGPSSAYVAITENGQLESENLLAYELGYRIQPTKNTSLDLTGFINKYDDIRTLERRGAIPPDIVASLVTANRATSTSEGIEIAGNWDVTDKWSLRGSYSYLDMTTTVEDGSTDNSTASNDARSPHNIFNIRSSYRFSKDFEMNNALYYVGPLAIDNVPGYYRLDSNIIWQAADGVELSLVGQNLLDPLHQEFRGSTYNTPSEVPRSVFGKVTFRF